MTTVHIQTFVDLRQVITFLVLIKKFLPMKDLRDCNENSWTRWGIDKSNGLTRVGISKVSESIMNYIYLALGSQSAASSSITGTTAKRVLQKTSL